MSEPPKVAYINRAPVNPNPEPDQAIIDQLEKMLAAAESGQLQAIFAVGWNFDNSIVSGWQGAHRAAFTLIGGVEQCKLEYMLKEFERR